LNDLKTRHDAEDHQGVVDLTVEVCGVAAALRTTHFITSACMYMYIGQGHLHSHLYQDAIGSSSPSSDPMILSPSINQTKVDSEL
jgi:hypothetical protein